MRFCDCSWTSRQPCGRSVLGGVAITSYGVVAEARLVAIRCYPALPSPLLLFAALDYMLPSEWLADAASWHQKRPYPWVIHCQERAHSIGEWLEYEYCLYSYEHQAFHREGELSVYGKSGSIYAKLMILPLWDLLPLLAAAISDHSQEPCEVHIFSDGLNSKTLCLPEDVPVSDIIQAGNLGAGCDPKLLAMLEEQLEAEEALLSLAK